MIHQLPASSRPKFASIIGSSTCSLTSATNTQTSYATQVLACVGDKVKGAICICEGFMSDGLQQEIAAANQALHFILLLQDQSQLVLPARRSTCRGRQHGQNMLVSTRSRGQGRSTGCRQKEKSKAVKYAITRKLSTLRTEAHDNRQRSVATRSSTTEQGHLQHHSPRSQVNLNAYKSR